MSENPQQKEQLAKSIVGFLDKYGDRLYNSVKKISKKAFDESRINWRFGYENYLEKSLNKYFYAKTFLSYNEPLPLYDLYVPLSVTNHGTLIEKTSVTDLMSANKLSIIMATGGSGKTMMMRHLFVDSIKRTSQVPVFVELRELNDSELDLFGLIKKKLRDNKFDFGDEYIEKAFEAGHFILLLDGFDEVAYAKRQDTIKQLDEISDKYEKNYIIISSRPDDFLYYWWRYNNWRIETLTLDLACELVEKSEAGEEIKEKFIKALKDELFEKHKSFLSNPLLLAIMLITYKNSAKIPEKISTFYENAFFALFQQHDARKAYDRDKRSKLDILDFRKVFSAFCFFTYKDDLYNFSELKAFEYLDKTQKYTGMIFEKKDFLYDCIQAVCLLVRDGLDITFSHRSFQEYFIALFVSKSNNDKFKDSFLGYLLNKIKYKREVFELLLEISPETIEKNLIIPKIEKLENITYYNKHLTSETYKNTLKFLYKSLKFQAQELSFEVAGENNNWKISAVDGAVNYVELINHIISRYLKFEVSYLFNENSELFKTLTANRKIVNQISFDINLEDEQTLISLSKGNHWLSKNYLQQIFDIKIKLMEKHKKQERFLEDELSE